MRADAPARVPALLLSIALQGSAHATSEPAVLRGEALFEGAMPLRGRVDGHASELPSAVLVCANCHVATNGDLRPGDAPDLRGGWLHRSLPRRNGPVHSYDAAALCSSLRTGVDPAQIRLPSAMPRFIIADEDCRAIWAYLESSASERP